MILYKATKDEFIESSIGDRSIADLVKKEYEKRIGKVKESEYRSWQNSLRAVGACLETEDIPDKATVCVEYKLQNRGSRIDFLIAGKDETGQENVVIVELKQWTDIDPVEGMDLVSAKFYGGSEVTHPAYQALSYAITLEDYNEAIEKDGIKLYPCAYLHNYSPLRNDPILDENRYPEIKHSPIFTRLDDRRFAEFIKTKICQPDTDDIINRIDGGRIRPSKSLQDVLGSMLRGNREFILIDNQKTIFEKIMHEIYKLKSEDATKVVYIVEGGPGTGKSVLAVNLLVDALRDGKSAAYVTKNAAPREVYKDKLAKDNFQKNHINNIFLSSGCFGNIEMNAFDVLLVDEAHRLNEKSGFYGNKGENQIKELINAAKILVFFIDENQRVTNLDIGSIANIKSQAKTFGATVHKMKLESQFRCNGSDGYLSFLNDILEIKRDDYTFDYSDYDIRVVDDPNELRTEIMKRNMIDNKARMLAGYCWRWKSKNEPEVNDIVIPEFNFEAKWNMDHRKTWAIDFDTVDQVGCIHTSQGLEFSYVGVIIGDDLRYENGHVITDISKRATYDKSVRGLKELVKNGDYAAMVKADKIIRNTYKTLLSRAMKGCVVYCTDKALANHISQCIEHNKQIVDDFYRQTSKL